MKKNTKDYLKAIVIIIAFIGLIFAIEYISKSRAMAGFYGLFFGAGIATWYYETKKLNQ